MSKWTLSPPAECSHPKQFHRCTINIVNIHAVAVGGLPVGALSSSRQLEKIALVVGDVLVRAQSVDSTEMPRGIDVGGC